MQKLKSLGAVIDFAIAREMEAFDLYQELAENAPDGKARDIFLGFAADEVSHKRKLDSVKAKSNDSTLNKTTPPLEINCQFTKPAATPDMNFHEALAFAIQCEKDAFNLYSCMAESTAFPPLKAICTALAKDEEKHQLRLETLYKETA